MRKKYFIINFFLGLALNNSIVVYAQEEELGKYEWIKEELDIKPFDFLTMRENFILYDQDQSSVDSQLSDMCYYKYNIEDKTTTVLGKIDDWYLTSSDYTFNQSMAYIWYQVYTEESGSDPYNIIENLYCIDYDKGSVKMVRKENVYQQLIFQDTIDQYLAFMKGNFDENQGIASIQLIPFSKIEGAQSKTVVEKKYDQKKLKGEWIEQFCAENGELYVVVREFDDSVKEQECKIEVYDVDGTCIREIYFNDHMKELVQEKNIVTFEVLGKCAFCKMTSGSSLILDLSGDQAQVVVEWDMDDLVDISISENATDAILFGCLSGKIWKWEAKTNMLYEFDSLFEQINRVAYDGKKNAVVITAQEMQAKDAYLIDLEEMPVKGMMCLQ